MVLSGESKDMKTAITAFSMITLLFFDTAFACTIQGQKKIQIGGNEGIEGVCSNSGLPISCADLGSDEVSCSGPGGGYSGYDLETLIFSACGCSAQEENEQQLKKDLNKKNAPNTNGSY
jgi:hypothetical protein